MSAAEEAGLSADAGPATGSAADLPWYHTLELPGGVVTAGFYDLRDLPAKLPIPASLAGKRCLDVGSSTGFWAFELERRGAAEVISLDLDDGEEQDWQGAEEGNNRSATTGLARRSFEFARAALGSEVQRVNASVYDISELNLGTFQFVFIGSLLLHLRDPIGALAALRPVTDGQLLSLEPISPALSMLRPRSAAATLATYDTNSWWIPNAAAHRHYLAAAGFRVEAAGSRIRQRLGEGFEPPPLRIRSLDDLIYRTVTLRSGLPSAWALGS